MTLTRHVGDGDKTPDRRGELGVSRKTVAQGMSGVFGLPVVTNSCAFYFAREAAGEPDHPAFPAPSHFRGTCF
jgi:hypothetical protein